VGTKTPDPEHNNANNETENTETKIPDSDDNNADNETDTTETKIPDSDNNNATNETEPTGSKTPDPEDNNANEETEQRKIALDAPSKPPRSFGKKLTNFAFTMAKCAGLFLLVRPVMFYMGDYVRAGLRPRNKPANLKPFQGDRFDLNLKLNSDLEISQGDHLSLNLTTRHCANNCRAMNLKYQA